MHRQSCRAAISALMLAWLAVPHGACAAAARGVDGARIVLFGARWCAPCRAELQVLPQMLAELDGEALALAWIDVAPMQVPGGPAVLAPGEARRLAEAAGGLGFGLPFAARYDVAGRLCAVWKGPLRPGDLARLRRRCAEAARRAT